MRLLVWHVINKTLKFRLMFISNVVIVFYLLLISLGDDLYGRPLPPKIKLCQIAQTKRQWSSDKLRNGSNNREMVILKIK